MFPTLKFIIKNKNKSGQSTIYLRFLMSGKSDLINTGQKIEPNKWNKQLGKAKANALNAKNLNAFLTKEMKRSNDILYDLDRTGTPITFQNFKKYYSKSDDGIFLHEYAKNKLEESYKTNAIEESSYRVYQYPIKKWVQIIGDVKIQHITDAHVSKYMSQVTEQTSIKTASIYTKSMKRFYQQAIDQYDFQDNKPFKNVIYDFTVKNKKTPLTIDQLNQLKQAYLQKKIKTVELSDVLYENLRAFLFMCHTSIRFSDARKIRYNDIHLFQTKNTTSSFYYIEFIAQKTKKNTIIPLLPYLLEYLIDVDQIGSNQLIFTLSKTSSCMNKKMKNIQHLLGFNAALTSHVARHTFGSLSIRHGMNRDIIQTIMQHTSEDMTKIYSEIKVDTLKEQMSKAWTTIDKPTQRSSILLNSIELSKKIMLFLKNTRKQKKILLSDCIELLNMKNVSNLSRFENGVSHPTMIQVLEYCKLLDLDIRDVLDEVLG